MSSPTPDFDTAIFSGPLANYTFTVNGVAATAAQVVAATANDIITVTDTTTAGIKGDGTDTIRHIERLQFSDQALVIDGLNHAPAGLLTIDNDSNPLTPFTPREDQLLTVSIAGVTDPDNVSAANPTGAITRPVSYFWQAELNPGDGIFTDITRFAAGEVSRVEGTSFTPTEPFVGGIGIASLVGLSLRVRAVYQDANGVLEQVFSAATAPVANVNDPPLGAVLISDTTPTETLQLTAINNFTDADGLTTAVFDYEWQQANATGVGGNAAGWTSIATGQTFTPAQAQVNRELRVVVTYIDDHGTLETLFSAPTTVTGDFIPPNAAAQILTGTDGQDIIFGGGGADILNGRGEDDLLDGGTGADILNGGDGNDTLTGGAGADSLNGGAGNDTFNYTMISDGADAVEGGADSDTLTITGTANGDTLNVVFNGTRLTNFGNGTLGSVDNVEVVTADLLTGVDTLTYAGTAAAGTTTAAVTVDLSTGSASGFTATAKLPALANIENVTGGAGNDTLTGNAGTNRLEGGAGNDTLDGGLGTDTLTGGGGVDTASYAQETDAMFVDLGAGTARRGAAGAAVEDTLTGIENVTGGAGADVLTGNGGANALTGGSGNDTFNYTFGGGTDAVDGGVGQDTLNITGTTANNTLDVLFNGTALTNFEGGTVTNVERVTADLLTGVDTLTYAGTTANVTVNLATNSASGFAVITSIENVTGGSGNDTLTGNAEANRLEGGAGNDTLDGQGGADTLIGGTGDDTFITDGGDTLTEVSGPGGGTDTVQSSENFTLAVNFENLTLTGAGNITGTGNASANILTGNDGINTLSGAGGNDTLSGGLGNDTLSGGLGNDTLNGGANTDTLTGGGGDDTFVFDSPGDAGNGVVGTRDVITDFQGAGPAVGDVINVSPIDANTGLAGNQAFTFIGTTAFFAAGQLRYSQDTTNALDPLTIVEGNVIGISGAEFQIALKGLHTLSGVDFIL